MFDSKLVAAPPTPQMHMCKMVPDPPNSFDDAPHQIEDLLVHIAEYLVCALTAAQHAAMIHTKPPGQVMGLSRVQARH
ncbi:hypothetical protein [Pseudomonas mosselii]|nr:hypothetical protein [Pseudomonas mosselii]MCL8301186.1 hypothetical protein [Pseudomonas mosselii]MCL8341788.1 hypothetical protein [Pseudomonas mosselii]MCU9531558.1 hypothetical protein [Pseudomonas mosselii]MCU9539332.1 hypothetical protein [Pseudomonas mosselii]MCU9544676.1 hypothetical protein [Pseudomonas mosselii]